MSRRDAGVIREWRNWALPSGRLAIKPGLFWTILFAFALVIGLQVVAIVAFFTSVVAGLWPPDVLGHESAAGREAFVQWLADYYVAHDNSWEGIGKRLENRSVAAPPGWYRYVLLNADGRVIASSDPTFEIGAPVEDELRATSLPVEVQGAHVGSLILPPPGGPPWAHISGDWHGPPDFLLPILRSFLLAAFGVGTVLLLLATLFARQLSGPIRRITAAAQEMAAGRLDVRVEGAHVRELDDLSQTFNRMAQALEQADRQRRQMTADVAHELRTPLSIIKGRLEGLQDGVYTATPDQIERLIEETDWLERLVEDLRVLAQAEAGQLALYREPVSPRELLEDAVDGFAAQAQAHGVELRLDAPDDLPLVDADPQRMAQVLANLVTNALRHTPPGGTIALEARRAAAGDLPAGEAPSRPPAVLLCVRDSGEGIAAEDLPHIFDRFWRADRSRARASGGGGLGLAIAKEIVAIHGGAIWADSAPKQGTTVSIALPAAAPEMTAATRPDPHRRGCRHTPEGGGRSSGGP